MKQIITFEGIIDTMPDQEFDMNCLMIKPVLSLSYPGNLGGIDEAIEEYVIDLMCGQEPEDDDTLVPNRKRLENEMIKCRDGKQGRVLKSRGTLYWKRVVEVDLDDEGYFQVLERVCL